MQDPPDCADTELAGTTQYSTDQLAVGSADRTYYVRGRVHIATLEKEMEKLEDERDEFARQVSELETEIQQLEAEIDSLEQTIEQKDNQLDQVIDNYETILERKDTQLEAAQRTESDSRLDVRRLFTLLS